jgi:single-strand DNA-binding protein
MNQVILTGRLTKDPELRTTNSDKSVASFSIAVDKYGEGADFINCVVWGKQAENLCKYQEKGSQIALSGRISTRTYDDAKGNKQYITEVVADSIEFLGSKRKEETEYDAVQNARKETNPFEEFGNNIKSEGNGIEISDSDLPF